MCAPVGPEGGENDSALRVGLISTAGKSLCTTAGCRRFIRGATGENIARAACHGGSSYGCGVDSAPRTVARTSISTSPW
jgi:hypothetical protein